LFGIIAALNFAYALLKPDTVAARFIPPGTAFQGSPARTVKKFRLISNRPSFAGVLQGILVNGLINVVISSLERRSVNSSTIMEKTKTKFNFLR
jgi:hypothetical protein